MAAQCLDGRKLAAQIQTQLTADVARLRVKPALAALVAGDDPATEQFRSAQERLAQTLGLRYTWKRFATATTQADVAAQLATWNRDRDVHGIFVHTPLPRQLHLQQLASLIDPLKDVEGIGSPRMVGRGRLGPCTALAVMALIESTGEPLRGKEAVIIGRSEIVGRPVCMLLVDAGATTTVCHTGTSDRGALQGHVERAEVLVAAAGRAGLVKGAWVRPGAIVIDVGTNVVDGKTVGDVEFAAAAQRAQWITPVPGGVGPMTTTMVMKNLLEAYKLQQAA